MVAFGATILVFLYICGIGIKIVFRYNIFRMDYKRALSEYNAVLEENHKYEILLSKMQDDHYWEINARQKLKYIKPGEEVYKYFTQVKKD